MLHTRELSQSIDWSVLKQSHERPLTSVGGRKQSKTTCLLKQSNQENSNIKSITNKHLNNDTKSILSNQETHISHAITNILGEYDTILHQQLLIACEKGQTHAVFLLLHQPIHKERCKGMNGYSPLHYATCRGHLEIVDLLLRFGWSINEQNNLGETSLHLSCQYNYLRITECLLTHGANVNITTYKDHETPLFYAVRINAFTIVRLLLQYGCDSSCKNIFGDIAENETNHERTLLEFIHYKESSNRKMKKNGLFNALKCSEQYLLQCHRERILNYLDLKSLGKASLVSYQWHRAADASFLWKKFGLSRWELVLQCSLGFIHANGMHERPLGFRLKWKTSSNETKRPASSETISSIPYKQTIHLLHDYNDTRRPQSAGELK